MSFWLKVTTQQVSDMNASLPSDTRVSAVTLVSGELVVPAQLLQDCATGQTYEGARAILQGLEQIEGTAPGEG